MGPHLKERWLHFSWSAWGTRPVLPAHRMLSQAKYMARLRWATVMQKRSTMSDRWMARLAASSASAELPSRNTAKAGATASPGTPTAHPRWAQGCLSRGKVSWGRSALFHPFPTTDRLLVRKLCLPSYGCATSAVAKTPGGKMAILPPF